MKFMSIEERLTEKHEEELFPFLSLLTQRHKEFAPAKFPALCKVANAWKRKLDTSFRDCQSTKESPPNLLIMMLKRQFPNHFLRRH